LKLNIVLTHKIVSIKIQNFVMFDAGSHQKWKLST
jgi:hypothetical protein